VVDLLQLFIPRVIKRVVDDLTLMQVDRSGLLDAYAMIILALGLCIGFFRFLLAPLPSGHGPHCRRSTAQPPFLAHPDLSPAYFDRVRTGDLMAHATNDIQQVRMASGMGLVALNDALFLGSAAIGFMVYINLELTLYVSDSHAADRSGHPVFQPADAPPLQTGAGRLQRTHRSRPGTLLPVSASSWPTMPKKLRPARLPGSPMPMSMKISTW
jgi:ABC-type multidrug transport system fused ATPase/permease subunit